MRIEYEPNLIEQAVFLAVRQDAAQEREFHAATDGLYALPAGRVRESKFNETYAAFFSRLGLDVVLSDLLAEPDHAALIQEHVGLCVVGQAPRGKTGSAELLVRPSKGPTTPADRTLVIRVCPQSLLDRGGLAPQMRRELLHVADMLDDRFGYHREAIDGLPARQNLIRDRYRVLWDIYVEARLHRRGLIDEPMTDRLEAMLRRAFAVNDARAGRNAFNRVFRAAHLTHRQLLDWAGSPETLLARPTRSGTAARQGPGEACPLCGFPTHDWFPFEGDVECPSANAIRSTHPNWRTESGACRQCAELHAATVTHRSG